MLMRWTVCLLLLFGAGCAHQLSVFTENAEYVSPVDFSHSIIEEPLDEVEESLSTVPQQGAIEEGETILIEEVLAEFEEQDSAFTPELVGIPLTVEALVGQVNGRPVYANTVLDPVADQIEAASKKMSRTEFADEIRKALYSEQEHMGTTILGGRMYELVITDLLLSEAMSGMSKEQSYGLVAIVGQMRDDLASSQGGSQAQLRETIEEQAGLTVDKFLELQRDQILIDALYRQKIWPKVNVTWRDIQREFEQVSLGEQSVVTSDDEERINQILLGLQQGIPLGSIEAARGVVTLGMIRLSTEDPQIVDVHNAFAEGLSFQEIANRFGIKDDGVWETFQMGLGGIEDIEVGEVIKKHLVGVSEGDYVEPFELGSSTVWIAVLDVQQPVSLYNRQVQIAMQNALRFIQFNREKDRYVESLWGEGSLEEVKSMADRVTNIAVRRYQQ